MGEVLALSLIPPPTTSLRQGVWFGKVVTGLLRLPGPIKLDMWSVHNTRLAIGTKMARPLTNTGGGYNLGTLEFPRPSPHPSLLSEPLSPNCPARSHPQYMSINISLYSSYIHKSF
jgi:hypothetical protein